MEIGTNYIGGQLANSAAATKSPSAANLFGKEHKTRIITFHISMSIFQ